MRIKCLVCNHIADEDDCRLVRVIDDNDPEDPYKSFFECPRCGALLDDECSEEIEEEDD